MNDQERRTRSRHRTVRHWLDDDWTWKLRKGTERDVVHASGYYRRAGQG